jgi:methyl-accepting chemotaxis protein
MLKNEAGVTIARRIVVLVWLPVIAMAVLAGWLVTDRWTAVAQMQRLLVGSTVIQSLTEVVGSLQLERGRSALFLGSKGSIGAAELAAQREQSDAKRQSFTAVSDDRLIEGLSDDVVTKIRAARASLNDLSVLRMSVSRQAISASEATQKYTRLIEHILDVSFLVIRAADQTDVKNFAMALGFLQEATEKAGIGRASGLTGLSAGAFNAETLARLATMGDEEREFVRLFEIYAPAEVRDDYIDRAKSRELTEADRLREIILRAGPGEKIIGVGSDAWFSASTTRIEFLREVQQQLLVRIQERTQSAASSAQLELTVATAITVSLVVMIVVLGGKAANSISKPLSAMALAMRRIANGDLEIEIPGHDRKDEVGEMAAALAVFREAAREKVKRAAGMEEERRRVAEAQKRTEEQAIEGERELVTHSFGSALAKLAQRDLSHRMTENLPRAYARLQQDFNRALDQLESALGGVISGVKAFGPATKEISSAADDLSHRTERQAASLEEAAAALHEITATVSSAAKGAAEATQIVMTTKNDAVQSGEIVERAIEAMERIEKSSQEIGQVIGAIDEIAFQTNLLALNAGVEAARAGDTGKGFAVVAAEVRALAQRSAEAAKHIKSLISASAAEVEHGVELVGQTGVALKKIVQQVNDIDRVVADIAGSAREQATSLSEINTTVGQMDQTTQQNAAMVQETTAAAHRLRGDAAELVEAMMKFRLSGRASGQLAAAHAPEGGPRLKLIR